MNAVKQLQQQLHAIELESNKLRQQLADSQYTTEFSGDGTPSFTIITGDEWKFDRAGIHNRSPQTELVRKALSQMLVGDMTRIGPFASNKEANTIRARVAGIAREYLKWGAGRTVETHVKGVNLFVKRLK